MKTGAIGLVLIAGGLTLIAGGFGQTPEKAPDTLQALLAEVRQLRQDIEAMTAASQRVQIALYALQIQDAAVGRATQRLDGVRNKCFDAETNKQHTAAEVERLDRSLAAGAVADNTAKDFKDRLTELKFALEMQTAEVQNCRVAESESTSEVRNGETKLRELQDRIAKLDKALEQFGPAVH
jgi:septation ring formation regulator EzrA